jgi:hypothetical protein
MHGLRESSSTAPIAGQSYEELTGRAFGELNPRDRHNTELTDIGLAPKNARGNVEYIASFRIRRPTDMSTASGLMRHDVPNRGGNVASSKGYLLAADRDALITQAAASDVCNQTKRATAVNAIHWRRERPSMKVLACKVERRGAMPGRRRAGAPGIGARALPRRDPAALRSRFPASVSVLQPAP